MKTYIFVEVVHDGNRSDDFVKRTRTLVDSFLYDHDVATVNVKKLQPQPHDNGRITAELKEAKT